MCQNQTDDSITATPQDELLCTYAALILHDDGAASWMIFLDFWDSKTVEKHGGMICFPT